MTLRGIRRQQWLAIIIIAGTGLNLRPIVNGFGSAIPAIRDDLGLSATVGGVLNALPGACFVVFGLLAPTITARLGTHRTVVAGLVTTIVGQVVRVVIPELWAVFTGSVIALAGIAVINILLPGVVRTFFPRHVPTVTAIYTTCLMLGATAGSGLTIPIAHAFGSEWRAGLGSWTIIAVLAIIPWLAMLITSRDQTRTRQSSAVPVRAMLTNSVAWWIALFFSMQAMQAYVVTGWLSQILVDAGVDLAVAGSAVAVFAAAGLPMAMVIPMIARRQSRFPAIVIVLGLSYIGGYAGLLAAPDGPYILWALLLGTGGGTFPLAMLIVVIRARSHAALTALSAFAQSTAYLFAMLGPFFIGFLHDTTGSWDVPISVMIAAVGAMIVFGLLGTRQRYVDDHLKVRTEV